MKKHSIVEINGRKYDANTGKIVSDNPAPGAVIDGFRAPVMSEVKRQPRQRNVNQASAMHRKPQKTMKLHPALAKKPVAQQENLANRQISGAVSSQKPRQLSEEAKAELNRRYMASVQAQRVQRAQAQEKSAKIQKFYSEKASDESASQVVTRGQDIAQEKMAPAAPVLMPKPEQSRMLHTPSQQQPHNVGQVFTNNNEAESEEEKKTFFKRRPKLATTMVSIFVLLILGGVFAYKNLPNMALRVASSRAGFSAGLPGYKPSGFDFSGPVAYTDGVVELEYTSNTDDRSFKLVQKESSWDSKSLLDNYVETTTSDYLTFQERGLTVYVYDDSNATWVDGGVWYTIEGKSLLNSEQLLKIAGSL